ncbi:hypothetical protein QC762_0012110 [Podospora pseudocomata]|uniref:Uncharacterized protein n=1 Tax=Podospora pseudocomata TaxID=2093779 RepID=A0ABR0GVY6_9PEZI|nr:hypothetical protein QC762_0012110 [Podospora pseudocomata]
MGCQTTAHKSAVWLGMETSELSARCGRDGRAISTVQNYPDLTTIFRDGYGIAIDRGGCAWALSGRCF